MNLKFFLVFGPRWEPSAISDRKALTTENYFERDFVLLNSRQLRPLKNVSSFALSGWTMVRDGNQFIFPIFLRQRNTGCGCLSYCLLGCFLTFLWRKLKNLTAKRLFHIVSGRWIFVNLISIRKRNGWKSRFIDFIASLALQVGGHLRGER